VNTHVCGGEVANTTLFVDANNCGMDMQVCKNEPSKKQTSIDKEPCCKDFSKVIQGNDNNQQAKSFQLETSQIEFLATFVYCYINIFSEESTISSYNLYEPPSVSKNTQTFFQVFRI